MSIQSIAVAVVITAAVSSLGTYYYLSQQPAKAPPPPTVATVTPNDGGVTQVVVPPAGDKPITIVVKTEVKERPKKAPPDPGHVSTLTVPKLRTMP